MSDAQLVEIETRLRAASQLWFAAIYQKPVLTGLAVEDAEFIKHAPTDIYSLIAEVRRLKAEQAGMIETLCMTEWVARARCRGVARRVRGWGD